MAELVESDLECRKCGEKMSCLVTGQPSQPRARYVCPNEDWQGICPKETGRLPMADRCSTPGCTWPAGHETEHPHGRPFDPGAPCEFCGKPEPCEDCWKPITVAMFKGLCAEAGKDVEFDG